MEKRDDFLDKLLHETEEVKRRRSKVFKEHIETYRKAKQTSMKAVNENKRSSMTRKATIDLANSYHHHIERIHNMVD